MSVSPTPGYYGSPSTSDTESSSPRGVQRSDQRPLREPLFKCTGKIEAAGDGGPLDCITALAATILVSLGGILTCCECCSGNYIDVFTYQKLPFCKEPLEPNRQIDALLETLPAEIQNKLTAAKEQLNQLDQTLTTRRITHRIASTFLCPVVFLPRTITCVCETWGDCEQPPQSRRPSPTTKLDLAYQYTLPCLEKTETRGRLGLEQFLSPPEVQRMTELEETIIPGLEKKLA